MSTQTTSVNTTELSFWQRASRLDEKTAVVDPDGTETSFAELGQASNQVANGLRDLGLNPGDTVAIVLPNSRVVYEVFSAVLQSGLYFTPVNWHLTAAEIGYILLDSSAKAVITDASFADTVRPAADHAGIPADGRLVVAGTAPGFRSYEQFKASASDAPPADRQPGQRLYYTSGTTGRPKAVLKPRPDGDVDLSAARFAANLFGHSGMGTYEDGVHLVTGPTYHPSPLGFGMAALHFGQTVVLMGKWNPEATLDLIDRYGVTDAHFVPTMFQRLMRLPDDVRKAANTRSLRNVVHAAAPCPPDLKRAIMDWWGPIVWEYYSSSEIGGTMVSPQEWLARPGTVGRPYPGAELKIVGENGIECPNGEPGLVYFKVAVPFEYKGDIEKTAESRMGDYATVGDIGFLDQDGYLFLCDRKAETIISGGVNIYPAEVEAAILSHPDVADVAVVGTPDSEWGEQVKAVVQLNPSVTGGDDLASELIDWAAERIARFKLPRSVDFVNALPRGDNGKLLRRKVREQYWDDHTRKI